MIDPKLNEVLDEKTGKKSLLNTGSDEAEESQVAGTPRRGLSVNDTVAADANLSVGGRGADTSGVRAGAGAGAGSTHLSAGSSNRSPVPNVEPGPSGFGTTPLSDSAATLRDRAETSTLSHAEIAAHAYRCWHERGCPEGSPEEDWHRAERELREQRAEKSFSAGA
jgi:Protein of unknown function (DUF2934)